MTIPPLVTAALALGAGFLIVHFIARSESDAGETVGKDIAAKAPTQGTIADIFGTVTDPSRPTQTEGGSFVAAKLGLGASSPLET